MAISAHNPRNHSMETHSCHIKCKEEQKSQSPCRIMDGSPDTVAEGRREGPKQSDKSDALAWLGPQCHIHTAVVCSSDSSSSQLC